MRGEMLKILYAVKDLQCVNISPRSRPNVNTQTHTHIHTHTDVYTHLEVCWNNVLYSLTLHTRRSPKCYSYSKHNIWLDISKTKTAVCCELQQNHTFTRSLFVFVLESFCASQQLKCKFIQLDLWCGAMFMHDFTCQWMLTEKLHKRKRKKVLKESILGNKGVACTWISALARVFIYSVQYLSRHSVHRLNVVMKKENSHW